MDTYEAIMTRRSVPKTGPGEPTQGQIEKLLEAAVAAPNHHLTEPWRFVVFSGDARAALSASFASHAAANGMSTETAAKLPLLAPVVIAVVERPTVDDPHTPEIEDHYAVGAAIQKNMLLTAHDAGLVAMIRTGSYARAPEVREHVGTGPDEVIAGFVHVGYPLAGFEKKPPRKTPASLLTEWRGSDVLARTGADGVAVASSV